MFLFPHSGDCESIQKHAKSGRSTWPLKIRDRSSLKQRLSTQSGRSSSLLKRSVTNENNSQLLPTPLAALLSLLAATVPIIITALSDALQHLICNASFIYLACYVLVESVQLSETLWLEHQRYWAFVRFEPLSQECNLFHQEGVQ